MSAKDEASGQHSHVTRETRGADANSRAGASQGDHASTPVRRRFTQARPTQRRHGQTVPWWKRSNMLIFGTLGIILVLILFFILLANRSTSTSASQLAPASLVTAVTQVSPQVISDVGTGGIQNPLVAVPPSAAGGDLVTNGKPTVVYIGAEYCPYCAAERWSVLVALGRFGTFSNLHLTTSSSTDVYPDTPTFTFYQSAYTSAYVVFQSVEETTRDPNAPLQTPTAEQAQLLQTYDTRQYVGDLANGIPFVDYGNRFVTVSAGFSPQILSGLTQQEIADKLSNASDPVTRQIVGNANYLTAATCVLTHNQPSTVCTTTPIPQIEAQLPG